MLEKNDQQIDGLVRVPAARSADIRASVDLLVGPLSKQVAKVSLIKQDRACTLRRFLHEQGIHTVTKPKPS